MGERREDKRLGIRTAGLREWKNDQTQFNRYEATPYKALKALKKNYRLNKNDKLVDFGSGRGRVVFYLHNHFHIPVKGIEANDKTFDEALNNKKRYRVKAKHIKAPIKFQYGLAENYKIGKKDNCFFFFNPFSVKIFKKVVKNILRSVEKDKRTIDLILYYPIDEYKKFLKTSTPFTIINKIKVPGIKVSKEKFIIYRLREEDLKD